MKFNFKKIMSVVGGMFLVGATMGMANAIANSYPTPFVNNGVGDYAIVYGAGSAPSDLVAANKINTNFLSYLESVEKTNTVITSVTNVTGDFSDSLGVTEEGVFLEDSFTNKVYSDREIETLFDGKVEFDGEDYDAEETLNVTNLILKANDFDGVPYLIVPENTIEFKLVFEDNLNTSLISEEETLEFNLLGEEVEVSEWKVDEITFTKGKEVILKTEESIVVEDKSVVLKYVTDDAVYVEVGGVGKSIDEDETRTVNGVEIKVKDVFASSSYSVATLVVGTEIEKTISDSDEYAEDSIWEWVITNNSIGLTLVEDFTELDEDFNALSIGEKVSLPNNYACVLFDSIIEENSEEYTFELDDDFVKVKGNFESGIEDYGEIYVYTDGSIYEDDNLEDYISEQVKLGNTDLILSADDSRILIQDSVSKDKLVYLGLNLTQIKVDKIENGWKNITSKDEDFLTNYGILVENPEDSIEDEYFKINVPEEKLEATVSVLGQGKSITLESNETVVDTSAVTIPQIGGIVVLDTEIASVSDKNLIVVGGSCINSVAAKLLGVPKGTCGEVFTALTGAKSGQYVLDQSTSPYNTGKVALLVAGYNAIDTTTGVNALLA